MKTFYGDWFRLPEALRARPQWAVAGANKAPMGIKKGKLANISVTSPGEWLSFDMAVKLVDQYAELVTTHELTTQKGLTLGYILNESDPFTCVDLDVKDAETHPDDPSKWTSMEDFERYTAIVKHLDSYTERSRSGKGLHVWARGNIGRGFRRDGVEVYSQERFIICTGDVYVSKTIEPRQNMLLNMVQMMRPVAREVALEEVGEEVDDWHILGTAASASNGDKFAALWKGQWSDMGYESQSEADLALMSMFTFYSPSNEQCRRLFRDSALGKREKAVKNNRYLNFTLKLIRERQAQEQAVELSAMLRSAETMRASALAEVQRLQGGVPAQPGIITPFGNIEKKTVTPLEVVNKGEPVAIPAAPEANMMNLTPVSARAVAVGKQGLAWPPGQLGKVAQYIFNSSYLPIKEVSICAALGLCAGIVGKAWHIPKSGLNLYIVLVARSAIGKEALHEGIASIVNACTKELPSFGNFVDFNEHASGPALVKACSQRTSFVNVSGEWGRRMKAISGEDGRGGPMSTLRTQMTNLYQKSGPKAIAGGISYSSQENNVEALTSIAYSMVGESTPQTFYDSLTQSMMEDGFLSRFLIVQYEGDRPDRNDSMLDAPDAALTSYMCRIAAQAEVLNSSGQSQPVQRTEEAARFLNEFLLESDMKIKSFDEESRRQMWNRAGLKALRVAAVIAVMDNFASPIISIEAARWAVDLIRNDIAIMDKRLTEGDVGVDDTARERKMVALMRDYVDKEPASGYGIDSRIREAGIIPRHYIQKRLARISCFYNHKAGASKSMDETLNYMTQNGYISDVKAARMVELYDHHGKGYRIIDLPTFNDIKGN